MKTISIQLARVVSGEVEALQAIKWENFGTNKLLEILSHLHHATKDIFSLEIYHARQTTHFCITARGTTCNLAGADIYREFPEYRVVDVPDFTFDVNDKTRLSALEMRQGRSSIYPLVTYMNQQIDTLAPFCAALSTLDTQTKVFLQLVCLPLHDTGGLHFRMECKQAFERLKHSIVPIYWFKADHTSRMHEAVRKKVNEAHWIANFRIAVLQDNPEARYEELDRILLMMTKSFYNMNSNDGNFWKPSSISHSPSSLKKFQDRYVDGSLRLATTEIVSIWHFPGIDTIPTATQAQTVRLPPPADLPVQDEASEICYFGHSNFRERNMLFGFQRPDRRQHLFLVGKSGTGKSSLIHLLADRDICDGYGMAIVDPHGDLVDQILKSMPEERVDDVVLFDPTDGAFPVSFNPFEHVAPHLRMRIAESLVDIFQKMFGSTWSGSIELLLRYTTLALLGTRGTSILSIEKLFEDARYRTMLSQNIHDVVVRQFWEVEFEEWKKKHFDDAVRPLLEKLQHLTSNSALTYILGQPVSRLNFRDLIDKRKIILMKLPSGTLGEDVVNLLSTMLIAKIYEAFMSRIDLYPEDREEFYFYVDEFQRFATPSFVEILSESRKFGLALTLATQHFGQLSAVIQQAIFGNIGNIVAFQTSPEDADILLQEFRPGLDKTSLINLPLREFYVKMTIGGKAQFPFSGKTMTIAEMNSDAQDLCKIRSRQKYALPREHVKNLIRHWESALLKGG